MSVAVQQTTEKAAGSEAGWSLAAASLFGTLYVLFGWVLVNHLIPILFWLPAATEHLVRHNMATLAFMVVCMAAAPVGLVYLWKQIMPPMPGIRAGIFLGVVFLVVGLFLVFWTWNLVAAIFKEAGVAGGAVAPACVGLLWAMFWLRVFRNPKFASRMERWETNGWFSLRPFKKGQGLKARRATMLGVLLVAGAGIWVYFEKRHLAVASTALPWATYWAWTIPFARENVLPVIIWPSVSIPLLLSGLTIWFAYRLVNYPQFGDFLIATEAEMNKVSWATRKRLYQDTVVVLITVLLMAIFLYVVDSLLVWVLRLAQIMRFG